MCVCVIERERERMRETERGHPAPPNLPADHLIFCCCINYTTVQVKLVSTVNLLNVMAITITQRDNIIITIIQSIKMQRTVFFFKHLKSYYFVCAKRVCVYDSHNTLGLNAQ